MHKAKFRNVVRKTVFLLQLASTRRVSWIHACHTSPFYTRFEDRGVTMVPYLKYDKNQTAEYTPPSVHIPSLRDFSPDDKVFCPVRALKYYCDRADQLRGPEKALFISSVEPHKRARKNTVSGWVRSIIREAYTATKEAFPKDVDLRAHSTRKVGSSWALASGATMTEIMEAAAWKGAGTFGTHYQGHPAPQKGTVPFKILASAAATLRERDKRKKATTAK